MTAPFAPKSRQSWQLPPVAARPSGGPGSRDASSFRTSLSSPEHASAQRKTRRSTMRSKVVLWIFGCHLLLEPTASFANLADIEVTLTWTTVQPRGVVAMGTARAIRERR